MKQIAKGIYYVGVNDHILDLFEGQFIVPNGMAYNSYVIEDDLIAIMDSVDIKFFDEWIKNIKDVLGDKKPTYLVVQHMEPDHSANIMRFLEVYPDTFVVGNAKTFKMIEQFFHKDVKRKLVVNDNDTLNLGSHNLKFVFAPMVHWPEVMMTYEENTKTFFSADAFGKFGALDVEEDWACEARRYYFGIVGKYGLPVQSLLKKAATLDIETICPLHGPVLDKNLEYYLNLYSIWSSYGVETEGVAIFYTSVYGHTKEAALLLEKKLKEYGCPKVAITDLARDDMAEAVEDAFRYGKIVFATTSYNASIFPFMHTFVDELVERNFQNKKVAIIENGSWAPSVIKFFDAKLEKLKNIEVASKISITSSLSEENKKEIDDLAEEFAKIEPKEEIKFTKEPAKKVHKWVCKICGYVYEGTELPKEFNCPLCKHPASDFEMIE